MTDKEYAYEIAKDLFVNMNLYDLKKFAGEGCISRISTGDFSFEEAEKVVLQWRKERKGE